MLDVCLADICNIKSQQEIAFCFYLNKQMALLALKRTSEGVRQAAGEIFILSFLPAVNSGAGLLRLSAWQSGAGCQNKRSHTAEGSVTLAHSNHYTRGFVGQISQNMKYK